MTHCRTARAIAIAAGVVVLSLLITVDVAHAISFTFIELTDAPPVVTVVGEASTSSTAPETASGSALIRPATSPSPLVVGTTFAVLTEPGTDPFGPRISDIIRLTASLIGVDQGGQFQRITVDFFSDGFPGFSTIIPAGVGFGSTTETGLVQDVTSLLGINSPTQNVQVFAQSDLATPEVPEPATLILLGSGLAGLAGAVAWRRRRLR